MAAKGLYKRTTMHITTGDQTLLGIQLGTLLVAEKITMPKLEQELGVSKQTLYRWFRGEAKPRSRIILNKIAEILETYKP